LSTTSSSQATLTSAFLAPRSRSTRAVSLDEPWPGVSSDDSSFIGSAVIAIVREPFVGAEVEWAIEVDVKEYDIDSFPQAQFEL